MNKNVRQIGYNDTDQKTIVNIYGLNFSIAQANKAFIQKIDAFKNSKPTTLEELYPALDIFLGDGAAEKINKKRNEDGYDNLSVANIVAIIGLVVDAATKQTMEPLESVTSALNKMGVLNTNHNKNRARRRGSR